MMLMLVLVTLEWAVILVVSRKRTHKLQTNYLYFLTIFFMLAKASCYVTIINENGNIEASYNFIDFNKPSLSRCIISIPQSQLIYLNLNHYYLQSFDYNKSFDFSTRMDVVILGQSLPNNETCFGHSAIYSLGKVLKLIPFQIRFKLCGNTQQTITNHS